MKAWIIGLWDKSNKAVVRAPITRYGRQTKDDQARILRLRAVLDASWQQNEAGYRYLADK